MNSNAEFLEAVQTVIGQSPVALGDAFAKWHLATDHGELRVTIHSGLVKSPRIHLHFQGEGPFPDGVHPEHRTWHIAPGGFLNVQDARKRCIVELQRRLGLAGYVPPEPVCVSSGHHDALKVGPDDRRYTPITGGLANLIAAAREFVAKVDRGEARSRRSYQAFKDALAKIDAGEAAFAKAVKMMEAGAFAPDAGPVSQEDTETTRIDLDGGKYSVLHENGANLRALRHGEPWRDCIGDNLVFALASEVEEFHRLRDLTDADVNEIVLAKLGKWPSFEAQWWACDVVRVLFGKEPATGLAKENPEAEFKPLRTIKFSQSPKVKAASFGLDKYWLAIGFAEKLEAEAAGKLLTPDELQLLLDLLKHERLDIRYKVQSAQAAGLGFAKVKAEEAMATLDSVIAKLEA